MHFERGVVEFSNWVDFFRTQFLNVTSSVPASTLSLFSCKCELSAIFRELSAVSMKEVEVGDVLQSSLK